MYVCLSAALRQIDALPEDGLTSNPDVRNLCIWTNPSQIDSAFQLTEHLRALHYSLTHPENESHTVPIDKDMAVQLSQAPNGTDRALWLYELCRFLCEKVNSIIVALFADEPPCSSSTCPEMRASEWQYLCAVHDPPKSCCAIDYCCHTLDWAANTLTSPKHFPSRLALGTEASSAHQQVRQLTNVFRRVYRIFAHAWFQHRDVFWKVEGKTGLYVLFKTVSDAYNLIPVDNYTVPPEAEGLESTPIEEGEQSHLPDSSEDAERKAEEEMDESDMVGNITVAAGNTTKRHRQPHSRNASTVPTVVEEKDEEAATSEPTNNETEERVEASEPSAEANGTQKEEEKPEEEKTEDKAAAAEDPEIVTAEQPPSEDLPTYVETVIHMEPSEDSSVREEKSDDDPSSEMEEKQQEPETGDNESKAATTEPKSESTPSIGEAWV